MKRLREWLRQMMSVDWSAAHEEAELERYIARRKFWQAWRDRTK